MLQRPSGWSGWPTANGLREGIIGAAPKWRDFNGGPLPVIDSTEITRAASSPGSRSTSSLSSDGGCQLQVEDADHDYTTSPSAPCPPSPDTHPWANSAPASRTA